MNDIALHVHAEGGHGRGTAWHCWDAAVAAALWLNTEAAKHALGAPRRAVELGSGTGLGALALAAALRCPVTATDLPEALPALRRNAEANQEVSHLIEAVALDWRERAQVTAPLVLATDCVWLHELVPPFVQTLDSVLEPGGVVVLAHQTRSTAVDDTLWKLLGERGFTAELQELPPQIRHTAVRVSLLRRVAAEQS